PPTGPAGSTPGRRSGRTPDPPATNSFRPPAPAGTPHPTAAPHSLARLAASRERAASALPAQDRTVPVRERTQLAQDGARPGHRRVGSRPPRPGHPYRARSAVADRTRLSPVRGQATVTAGNDRSSCRDLSRWYGPSGYPSGRRLSPAASGPAS